MRFWGKGKGKGKGKGHVELVAWGRGMGRVRGSLRVRANGRRMRRDERRRRGSMLVAVRGGARSEGGVLRSAQRGGSQEQGFKESMLSDIVACATHCMLTIVKALASPSVALMCDKRTDPGTSDRGSR